MHVLAAPIFFSSSILLLIHRHRGSRCSRSDYRVLGSGQVPDCALSQLFYPHRLELVRTDPDVARSDVLASRRPRHVAQNGVRPHDGKEKRNRLGPSPGYDDYLLPVQSADRLDHPRLLLGVT